MIFSSLKIAQSPFFLFFSEEKKDLEKLNYLFSKLSYRFNIIQIKMPELFFLFLEINNLFPKFIWKYKSPRIGKTVIKKITIEVSTLLETKTYYKHTVIKTKRY